MKAGCNTPWGPAQTVKDLGRGVTLVSTAGHGGIFVPAKLLRYIPEREQAYAAQWSGSRQWYEEDCAMAIPLYRLGIVPSWLTAEKVAEYFASVKAYWEN